MPKQLGITLFVLYVHYQELEREEDRKYFLKNTRRCIQGET